MMHQNKCSCEAYFHVNGIVSNKSIIYLSITLRRAAYINDKRPGIATFMDTTTLCIAKNSFYKRLKCMKIIKFEWTNGIDANNNGT